jgi:hypothetical protein
MLGLPKVQAVRACPFCGVATEVAHETQEGCIAALHHEIGRMRGILATLKPAHVPQTNDQQDDSAPATIRLALDS